MLKFLRSLDPKLVSTILTAAFTRAVLALGGDPLDPLIANAISFAVGALAGYLWPNDGSALRQMDDLPPVDEVQLEDESPEAGNPPAPEPPKSAKAASKAKKSAAQKKKPQKKGSARK